MPLPPPSRRPQVFSIAVFGPIVNEGYVNTDSGPELRCVFNGNAGACRFGVALGLGAFLACAAFLLLDVRFQQISSVRDRRRAVLLDLGFSGGRDRGAGLRPGRGLPAVGGASRAGLPVTRAPARRALVLPVVRGLLLPHQPVAAHGARARHAAGGRRGAGRHRLQLLLHPQLGECGRRGPGRGRGGAGSVLADPGLPLRWRSL